MKLIDVDMLCKYCDNNINHSITPNEIMRMPFIDAEPVKHGRWIRTSENVSTTQVQHCSECGHNTNYDFPYCSNCGAKMDGGEVE